MREPPVQGQVAARLLVGATCRGPEDARERPHDGLPGPEVHTVVLDGHLPSGGSRAACACRRSSSLPSGGSRAPSSSRGGGGGRGITAVVVVVIEDVLEGLPHADHVCLPDGVLLDDPLCAVRVALGGLCVLEPLVVEHLLCGGPLVGVLLERAQQPVPAILLKISFNLSREIIIGYIGNTLWKGRVLVLDDVEHDGHGREVKVRGLPREQLHDSAPDTPDVRLCRSSGQFNNLRGH